MFFNDNGEHKILRVFDNGILIDSNLPIQVMAKFNRGHVENPFINEDIVKECEGLDLSSLEPLKNISSYVDPSVLKASQIAKEPTFKNAQANNMDSQMMMYQMMQMMQSMANNSGNALNIQTSNCTLTQAFQRKNVFCSHKNLYMNIHRSFTHNSEKLEKI